MSISPKNASKAARMTGLANPGPIHIDNHRELVAKTGRLAEFMDRLDQPVPEDVLQLLGPFRKPTI